MIQSGKFLIKICSLIIFLIAGILFLAPLFFDKNNIKPLITKWAKYNYQRLITFDGDLTLNFYPNLVIEIDGLSISEYQQDKIFASVQQIHLSTPLSALLKTPWVIDTIRINKIKGNIIRFDDGRSNIDDLIRSDAETSQLNFSINRLNITNANLNFHDANTNTTLSVHQLNMIVDHIQNHSLKAINIDSIGQLNRSDSTDTVFFDSDLSASEIKWNQQVVTSGSIHLVYQVRDTSSHIKGSLSIPTLFQTGDQLKSDDIHLYLSAYNDQHLITISLKSPFISTPDEQMWALPEIDTVMTVANQNNPDSKIKSESTGQLFLNHATKMLEFQYNGKFASSEFKARLSLSPSADTKSDLYLWLDTLNLNDFNFLPPKTKVGNGKDSLNSKLIVQTQPAQQFKFNCLNKLNLSGQVHIGQLQINDIQLHDTRLDIQSNTSVASKNHQTQE